MARARARPVAERGPLSVEELETVALKYLNRFDTSVANLERVLLGYVKKVSDTRGAGAAEDGPALVAALLTRYSESGLIDDARYASNIAAGLRRRGTSRRAIKAKLESRGLSADVIEAALAALDADTEGDSELEAARALVKRRRLGPHRPEAEQAPNRRKDLAALARAGFNFDVAKRALALDATLLEEAEDER